MGLHAPSLRGASKYLVYHTYIEHNFGGRMKRFATVLTRKRCMQPVSPERTGVGSASPVISRDWSISWSPILPVSFCAVVASLCPPAARALLLRKHKKGTFLSTTPAPAGKNRSHPDVQIFADAPSHR